MEISTIKFVCQVPGNSATRGAEMVFLSFFSFVFAIWVCLFSGLGQASAQQISRPELFFQRIEAGSFLMGSPKSETNRDNDEGQVEVTISRPFEIMTTEVTQRMWVDVMKKNPSRFKMPRHCANHMLLDGEDLCPDLPLESASWNLVQTYIRRRNEREGLNNCNGTPTDFKGCYRLPSEAEWEYAARGRSKTAYFFGEESLGLEDYAWFYDNSENKTHPAGQRKANPYGLYDMYGNVWEYVYDSYARSLTSGRDPFYAGPDPFQTAIANRHVIRGGGWYDYEFSLRSANRFYEGNMARVDSVGFRLVRSL